MKKPTTPRPHNQSTPTPWRQDLRQIYSADDDANIIIAEMADESWDYADNTESKPVQYANAALIVKAVNEHAALNAVAEAAKSIAKLKRANDDWRLLEHAIAYLNAIRSGKAVKP